MHEHDGYLNDDSGYAAMRDGNTAEIAEFKSREDVDLAPVMMGVRKTRATLKLDIDNDTTTTTSEEEVEHRSKESLGLFSAPAVSTSTIAAESAFTPTIVVSGETDTSPIDMNDVHYYSDGAVRRTEDAASTTVATFTTTSSTPRTFSTAASEPESTLPPPAITRKQNIRVTIPPQRGPIPSSVTPSEMTPAPFTLPLLFQTYRLGLVSFGPESLPMSYLQDLTLFQNVEELTNLTSISHHYMQFTHRYMHILRQKLFYVDAWLMHDRLGLNTHFDTRKQKRLLAFYDSFIFTLKRKSTGTDHSLVQLQEFSRLVPNSTIYLLLFDFFDKDKVLDIARTLSLIDVRVFDVSIGGEIVSKRRQRNSGIWQSFEIEDPSSFKKHISLQMTPSDTIFAVDASSDDDFSGGSPSPEKRRFNKRSGSGGDAIFQFLRKGKISDLTHKINSILLDFDDRYRLIPTHATDRDLLQEFSPIDVVSQLLQIRNASVFTSTLEQIARNSLLEPTLTDVMYGPLTEYLKLKDRHWVNGLNPSKIFVRLGWNSLNSSVREALVRHFFTMYIFPQLMERCYVFHRESYKHLHTYSAYLYSKGKWKSAAFGNHPFTPPTFQVCPETGSIIATYWIVHQRVTRYFFTRKTIVFPRDLTECRLTVTDQRFSVSRKWTLMRLFVLSVCCCFCCGQVKF